MAQAVANSTGSKHGQLQQQKYERWHCPLTTRCGWRKIKNPEGEKRGGNSKSKWKQHIEYVLPRLPEWNWLMIALPCTLAMWPLGGHANIDPSFLHPSLALLPPFFIPLPPFFFSSLFLCFPALHPFHYSLPSLVSVQIAGLGCDVM